MLSRNDNLQKLFADRFSGRFLTVGGRYPAHADALHTADISAARTADGLIDEPEADPKL
ncbi:MULTISPECIES: hypothetical protein [Bradyrhizobium]|uniref:hypothetical protein n=1 Tax=Bradyrhizobium sp. USDA 241 TaxID=3377725 RepID=UPI00235D81DC|nr:hypothetical protein QIH91_40850 [Bradyrhizobium japonicum USDA 135]GLR97058.1 hypothetical protein GCM10007858_46970 [Bradyrhizobium liaoningense]